ncbi:DUF1206 domain-containing protein [Isoptericola chiayiensis]|uniref:DUF1206 domain-containing protein n=1 Tax=Isoptericola chiayiensis TaxID=579446 RepID=A0ABP8YAG3_9MICO|nr:DUF1206 domain-containing protein [Isoptericola chiayiensis]NOW00895.1 hypothetical protein [Isoptericola chiayiensis]
MTADPANQARGAAQELRHSTALRTLARAGFVASGVLHLLIGWLAVQIAFGSSDGSADSSGAFQQLASAPGGAFLLWAVTVGFAALALWQIAEALLGSVGVSMSKQTGARIKAAAKGVLYAVLAVSAAQFATGSGGSGNSQEGLTAWALQLPGGRWIVAAAGLVIVGVGVYHVVKGARKKFVEDLRSTGGGAVGTAVVRLGQVGYIAKGVALAVLGGLFVLAGWQSDADQAGGLNQALQTIREQPFGTVLLVVVGLGIAAYGLYSFARARYARL